MRVAVLLLVIGCSSDPGDPPAPWTSGSIVRAQVYREAGNVVGLAGRSDTQTSFECVFDAATSSFVNCPSDAYLMWRDQGCTMHDIAVSTNKAPLSRYVVAATDDGIQTFELGDTYIGDIVYRDTTTGSCTLVASGAPARVTTRVVSSIPRLGHDTQHDHDGVHFTTRETDDGFSVVTEIANGMELLDGTGRVQTRYLASGEVRMYAGLYDSQLGAACIPVEASDKTLRCAPAEAQPIEACFTGSSCSGSELTYCLKTPGIGTAYESQAGAHPRIRTAERCETRAAVWQGTRTNCQPTEAYVCQPLALPELQLATE